MTVFDLHGADGIAARSAEHAVDLAHLEPAFGEKLLDLLGLGEAERFDRTVAAGKRRPAGKTRRVVAGRGRVDQRLVPLEIDVEIGIGEERRPVPAHGQDQPGGQIVGGDRLAVQIGDAVLSPERAGLPDGDIGLIPRQIRRHAHLLEPRLTGLPPDRLQIVGGGCERVGRASDQVALAVAVEIDGILVIVLRLELELTDLSMRGPAHLLRRQVSALDDLERIHELLAELFRTPAIEAQSGERPERLHIAHHLAEIGLQSPEGDEHRTRDAVLLLDLVEDVGVLLEQLAADLEAIARHHAAGELQEGLREHALRAILGDGRGIVAQSVQRVGDRVR